MIPGQVLQNLTFHISLQWIPQETLDCSGKKKKITPEGAHLQYHDGDVEQEEDDEDAGSGTEISKGTSSGLSESMRNLCLGWGCVCDLIQKILWQPILLCASLQPDSSWHVSFLPPWISAARPHHYCFLIYLFIYLFLTLFPLCCILPPHTGSLDPSFFWGGRLKESTRTVP